MNRQSTFLIIFLVVLCGCSTTKVVTPDYIRSNNRLSGYLQGMTEMRALEVVQARMDWDIMCKGSATSNGLFRSHASMRWDQVTGIQLTRSSIVLTDNERYRDHHGRDKAHVLWTFPKRVITAWGKEYDLWVAVQVTANSTRYDVVRTRKEIHGYSTKRQDRELIAALFYLCPHVNAGARCTDVADTWDDGEDQLAEGGISHQMDRRKNGVAVTHQMLGAASSH